MEKRFCITVKDVAEAFGISLPTAYNIVNREDFPKIRYGRKIIVPREAFEKWMADLSAKNIDLKEK